MEKIVFHHQGHDDEYIIGERLRRNVPEMNNEIRLDGVEYVVVKKEERGGEDHVWVMPETVIEGRARGKMVIGLLFILIYPLIMLLALVGRVKRGVEKQYSRIKEGL